MKRGFWEEQEEENEDEGEDFVLVLKKKYFILQDRTEPMLPAFV